MKWYLDKFSSEYLGFALSAPFHKQHTLIHSSITDAKELNLENESVVA